MLVKNGKTGERNVLCLYRLEAENVPDVSPIRKSTFARGLCPSVDIDTALSLIFNLEIGLHIYSFPPESVLTCNVFIDDWFERLEET